MVLLFGAEKRAPLDTNRYRDLPNSLGLSAYMDLRKFCKSQGFTDIKDWLSVKGLYREKKDNMREGASRIDWKSDEGTICSQILEKYPLIGEPVLPDDVLSRILSKAQRLFDRIDSSNDISLSAEERDVLTVAIVQHLKRQNETDTKGSGSQFWAYIYDQFGYRGSSDVTYTQRIYNVLRSAVRGSFLQHSRFFSSEKDTHQYYTSLRLHSLTPAQSMESLFEILLFFYTKDLEFSYIPQDPIFKALVNCIATRWDKDIEQQEDLKVRSNAMASGLKALFRERPDFMRSYCERIVRQIDAFVRGIDTTDPGSTLDSLLRAWYRKKTDSLRESLSMQRTAGTRSGRAVASAGMVLPCYVFEERQVRVTMPAIRLDHKADAYPVITMYQGDKKIYEREMEVYGRLSWTTRPLSISLGETTLDYTRSFALEVSITYDGTTLLEKSARLHRDYIVFNENGREVSPNTKAEGMYFIFAPETARVDTGDALPDWIDCDGQLMRLYVGRDTNVLIDGAELFLSQEKQGSIRLYPSIDRIDGLRGRFEGLPFSIYSAPITLDIRLPDGHSSLNYYIVIDNGSAVPLVKYCPVNAASFVLNVPTSPVVHHTIAIIELTTGRIEGRYDYAILPDVTFFFENDIFYDDGRPTSVYLQYADRDTVSTIYPSEDTDWTTLSDSGTDYDIEVRLPLIRGSIGALSIFALPQLQWHEDLPDMMFVKIHAPQDYSYALYLGTTPVPRNTVDGSFELSNLLSRYKHRSRMDPLSLMVKDAKGRQDRRILTQIVFEEYFTESPVCLEGGELLWQPEGRYVGGLNDRFKLIIDVPAENGPFEYAVGRKNEVADRQFGRDFPCGEFPLQVIKEQKSLFTASAKRTLYEGILAIGQPEQRRVQGKCLYLERARCWDMGLHKMAILDLPQTAGCLCDMEFQGYSIPSGEELEYPEYTGILYFYNHNTQQWQHFNDQDRDGYECINPVHVWIISPRMLILHTVYEEAVMIDRQYSSIVNRSLGISTDVQRHRILLPDYFEYSME